MPSLRYLSVNKQVICRGIRKACEVAVARLEAVSVKPVDDAQVSVRLRYSFTLVLGQAFYPPLTSSTVLRCSCLPFSSLERHEQGGGDCAYRREVLSMDA